MAKVHRLSRQDARRVAVRAQLLQRDRPADIFSVVRQLTLLQLDPTNAIAPSADLVAWSRLGSSYSPGDLRAALDERRLVELRAFVRPAEDLALYRAEMAEWPGAGELVGKVDAKADRKAGVLVVNAVHQDTPFTPAMAAGIDQEIAGLAAWLGLEPAARPEPRCGLSSL